MHAHPLQVLLAVAPGQLVAPALHLVQRRHSYKHMPLLKQLAAVPASTAIQVQAL